MREETAYERTLDLIALLEATGVRVPGMPSGFTPAAALDDVPPPTPILRALVARSLSAGASKNATAAADFPHTNANPLIP